MSNLPPSRKFLPNFIYFMKDDDLGLAIGFHQGYDRMFRVTVDVSTNEYLYEQLAVCATEKAAVLLEELLREMFVEYTIHDRNKPVIN